MQIDIYVNFISNYKSVFLTFGFPKPSHISAINFLTHSKSVAIKISAEREYRATMEEEIIT